MDDLTLAGPVDQHQPFWEKLTSLVDVEPPEPIYRVLGRNHSIEDLPWQQVAAEGATSNSSKPQYHTWSLTCMIMRCKQWNFINLLLA